MKKKILAILTVVLCLVLSSCSGTTGNEGNTEENKKENSICTCEESAECSCNENKNDEYNYF